jgi:pilus assembly protein CpaC
MHRTNRVPWTAFCAVLGLLLGSLARLSAQGQEAPPPPKLQVPTIIVPINGTQRYQMSQKQRIATVVNQKENIARVSPVFGDPTSVIITGLEPGVTRVEFTDVNGGKEYIDVIVQFDVEYLRSLLKRAVPTAAVDPIPGANNTIILTGTVAHTEDIETILRTTASVVLGDNRVINALRVGGVQQVQLCAVIARVQRTEARNMGFSFFDQGAHHFLGSTVAGPGASNSSAVTGVNGASSSLTQSANLVLGLVSDDQAFFGFLQALRNEGVAKVLSEPRLVTLSGRQASFLDGGEQAVPVPAGLGQVGVQFEEFGVRLNMLPIVLGNGKIHIEVEPEVSSLDAAAGTSVGGVGGVTVPGRRTQRVHTTVEMEDGQTLLIGGLIQHTANGNATKVPILGDLPYLGAAFSAKSFEDIENELVIMVTPHLVDPMSCDQLPKYLPGQETRTPDDCELFLEGILEAPRGSRVVCPGGHYVPAYKNGPTAGEFPCAGGHGCRNGSCLGGCSNGSCGSGCANGSCVPANLVTPVLDTSLTPAPALASPATPAAAAPTTPTTTGDSEPVQPVQPASAPAPATPEVLPPVTPTGGDGPK